MGLPKFAPKTKNKEKTKSVLCPWLAGSLAGSPGWLPWLAPLAGLGGEWDKREPRAGQSESEPRARARERAKGQSERAGQGSERATGQGPEREREREPNNHLPV